MAYPVTYEIERPEKYNRLTVLFRLILAIPQLILVGAASFHWYSFYVASGDDTTRQFGILLPSGGILTAVLLILVFLAWWAILFTGRFPASLQRLCILIYRWAQNVYAYIYLLTNSYPPFSGDRPYELRLSVTPTEKHNRLTILFRFLLVIPHAIVLTFLGIALWVVTVIAWFAILITGQYPKGLYDFSEGVLRWSARVAAYIYLFVDDYPPFSLAAEPGGAGMQARPA
jgi:Domain of unknown function (DUF4389)